ncbi:MAG: hypothetical protein AB1442_03690 [Nitrospirota bacterium]
MLERVVQKDIRIQAEEIIGTVLCTKDFICYKSGFKKLCRVKDIGLEKYVVCMDRKPFDCKFSLFYGSLFFCACPLRVLIAKELKR